MTDTRVARNAVHSKLFVMRFTSKINQIVFKRHISSVPIFINYLLLVLSQSSVARIDRVVQTIELFRQIFNPSTVDDLVQM